ncbi:Holliday junction resolvase-like protein [Chitinispirillum alkaliphilum]|nr:Holliday junction resolvase-like protein [Chitinispirillum alkaliphilum]
MKLMGIDYGRRRVGLAITAEDGTCIRSLGIIDRKKVSDPVSELLRIITAEQPELLVFGLPLDVEDRETLMSAEVRKFAQKVKEKADIPIHFTDESFSSHRAAQLLSYRKKKDRSNKALVDQIAACLILERYREEQ